MQKLLRTALFSVFALLLAAGMAVAPAQAQDADADATVTVDADAGDNIEDGLESLNTQLGNTNGGAGELRILANDYTQEGLVDLTEGTSPSSRLANIESLTIVAVGGQNGSDQVTVERITVDGTGGGETSNLGAVSFDSESDGFVRVAGGEFDFTKPDDNDATGDLELSIESMGSGTSALRLANNSTVTRGGNTTVATGSANAQYLDQGNVSSLTYNTDGQALETTPFFPASGSVATLELDGGGSVDFRSDASVATISNGVSDGEAGAGLDVDGSFDITNEALDLNNDISISATSISVQNGDLTIDEAGQSVTTSSGDLSVGSGSVTLSGGETGTTELDVTGELDVNGGIDFDDADANASVGSNVVSLSSVSATAGGESNVNDFDVEGTLNVGSGGVDLNGSGFEIAVASDMPIDNDGLLVDGNVVDVEGLLTVNTTSGPGSNGIEVGQSNGSSGSVLSSSDLTVTVDGSGTNAIDVTDGGTVESETGPIDVNGDQVDLSSGATFEAATDVSVTGGGVIASGSNTSSTIGGTLTVDVGSGDALDVTDAEVTVNGSGGTTIAGEGNAVRATDDADVSLGDVTFNQPNPRFNLAGLNAGTDEGLSTEEVTASFTEDASADGSAFIEGGGDFSSGTVTINPADPNPNTDDVDQGNTTTFGVAVRGDELSADYNLGGVSLGANVTDNDGTGEFATVANLNVQDGGSSAEAGRIVAAGSDFNNITTNAGGNGTVTIEGSNATTFAGTVTNNGAFTVETDATFDGKITNNGTGTLTANGATTVNAELENDGTVDANAALTYNRGSAAAITGTGTINIAADQTFTVNATASGLSDGDDIITNTAVEGDGTFDVNTDIRAEVRRGENTTFPTTQTRGSGVLEIRIDNGDNNSAVDGSITFDGTLTADAEVDFTTATDDQISTISITDGNSLVANADVRFDDGTANTVAYEDQGGAVIIDVPTLKVNAGTVNLAAPISNDYIRTENVTLDGSGTLAIGDNRLRVLQDFQRLNAPDPSIESGPDGNGTIELFADDNADVETVEFDVGDDLLTFRGTLEIDKDNDDGATVNIVNPVRIDGGADGGGINIIRPENNLASTTVNLAGNLIIRNGTFEVSDRDEPGTINVNTVNEQGDGFDGEFESELIFRGQENVTADNIIDTGDVIAEIGQVSNRDLSGSNVNVLVRPTTELTVSDQLRALGGGFTLEAGSNNSAILNPGVGIDDDEPEVIRGFPAGSPEDTRITGDGFNDAENTYDLAYEGEGTSTAGSELDTDFTRNVAVRDEVTLQLDQDNTTITGDLTVGPTAVVEDDDNSDNRTLTLSGSGTSHSIQGEVRGNGTNSEEVTLDVSGDNAQITGDNSEGNDDGAVVENLTVRATGVTATNLQQITGDVIVESGGLDLTLVDPVPSSGNDTGDQTIAGYLDIGGSQFTLGSPVEVQGSNDNGLAVDANSGEIALGSNDLTLTGGGFEATESVTYDADVAESEEDRGEIVLDAGSEIATFDDDNTSATPNAIPNLRVETKTALASAESGFTNTVGVSDRLVIDAGDENGGGIDLNGAELSASGIVALDATTSGGETPIAVNGSGTFDVSDATVQVSDGESESTSLNSDVANQEVSTLTVSGGSEVTVASTGNSARTLDVNSGLTLSTETGGSLNIQDNTVEVSGFAVTGSPGEAASVDAGDGYLAFNADSPPLTTSMTRGVNVDRLQVLANAELGDDGETFTVDETLWLNAQFDASATADAGQIAVGNEATIRRTEGATDSGELTASGTALTEAPIFAGDVSVVYDRIEDATATFEAGPELPASDDGTASLVGLTIDAGDGGEVNFPELENGVSSNPVTVSSSGTVDLESGVLEHGTDGTNELRRLTLADGAVFAQKNGEIQDNDGTRDIIDASSYTLRYYPTEDVTTSNQEFLTGAVETLEFIDDPEDNASGVNLTLHASRDVGSATVNREATSGGTSSDFDLDGNTLTVSGGVGVLAGEISDTGSGNTLDVNGTGGTLDNSSDLLIDGTVSSAVEVEGKTTVRDGGTLSGEVIVANGEIAVNTGGTLTSTVGDMNANITVDGTMDVPSITTSGDIDASNASTVDFGDVTTDGSSDQNIQVSENPEPSSFTLAKTAPSSGGPPVVTFSGSTLDLSGESGESDTVLELDGGLLKPTGSTDDVDDNLVNLGSNDYKRDLSGSDAASESHVVGGVTKTVPSSDNKVQPVYPVGSEDPATYRRYRFTFPGGSVGQKTDITVNHITEELTNTDPLPITDDTGVTIGTDFPAYYWQVTADQDLTLTEEYSVSARVTGQTLTFNSSRPASDHRLIRRNRSDNPENTTWSLVGDGSSYENEGPVEGVAEIRSRTSTADVTDLGRVFTVGVPAGPGPSIATNSGLTLTEGESAKITSDLLSADDNSSAEELTYTVTDGPSQGELQVDGSQPSEFTQADIDNGDVAYNHTATNADDDSFTFEVADPDGNVQQGTFDITVEQGLVTISGTVTYPEEGDGSLVNGTPLGNVTVEITPASGGDVITTPADGDGNFSKQVPAGEYTVEAQVSRQVEEEIGITANDALRTINAYLGSDEFTSFQQEVADVNDNGNANATDALRMALFFNAVGDPDTDVSFNAGMWYSSTETVDASSSDASATVYAAAYGDADLSGPVSSGGTNTVATMSNTSSSAAQTDADRDLRSVEKGSTFEVPVRLSEGATLGSYSLSVDFPAEKASFEGVASGERKVLTNAEDGTVRISWFDRTGDKPIKLSDGSKLVTLRFSAAEDVEKGATFSPTISGGELSDPKAEPIANAQVSVEALQVGAVAPEQFALKGNFPNPVSAGQTHIEMDMPKRSSVTVEVYNTLGQRIMRTEQSVTAGSNKAVQVDASALSSGQYFYRVSAEMDGEVVQETGRMTVVK